MRATFKLSDYGGTAPVHIFVGASGRQHTFTNKRDGHGYQLEFDGTAADYDRLMRDLLGARHPYHSCFVYFPLDEHYVKALEQSVHDLQEEKVQLATANQALVADLSELRMQMENAAKEKASRLKAAGASKPGPGKKKPPGKGA